MSHLLPTSFTRYDMTEDELMQGASLTVAQEQFIQNYIADLAEQKLDLVLDVDNINRYTQIEAHLSGQIAALKWLLESSKQVQENLKAQANHNL